MSLRGPELLGRGHVLDGFDCGSVALNDWLVRRSLANQQSGASRTWVVADDASRVVAYYASSTASIVRSFYLHYEFEPSPFDDLTLMRVITDLR